MRRRAEVVGAGGGCAVGGQGRPSKEGTFRRQLRGEKSLAMGISGARVDQAEGMASAKTPRQEQLDVFTDRGGGKGARAE